MKLEKRKLYFHPQSPLGHLSRGYSSVRFQRKAQEALETRMGISWDTNKATQYHY